MKKTPVFIISLFFLMEQIFGNPLSYDLSAGYTTYSGSITLARGTASEKKYVPFTGGIMLHSEAGAEVYNGLFLGISFDWLNSRVQPVNFLPDYLNDLNVMAGCWYSKTFKGIPLLFTGKLFAGITFTDLTEVLGADRFKMSANTFITEAWLQAGYPLGSGFYIILNTGYRYMSAPQFKYSDNMIINGSSIYVDQSGDGRPLGLDLSGFMISAGIAKYY